MVSSLRFASSDNTEISWRTVGSPVRTCCEPYVHEVLIATELIFEFSLSSAAPSAADAPGTGTTFSVGPEAFDEIYRILSNTNFYFQIAQTEILPMMKGGCRQF